MMKSSEPYPHALSMALANPGTVAALDEPIEPGFFVGGNIRIDGSTGYADLVIPLKDSRSRATVYVEAKKSAGQWHYRLLQIQIGQPAQRIDLLSPSAAPAP